MEMASSLIMYPIPNPSDATGPKPNSRKAGFPQFDVERMLVLSKPQPGSVNIAGRRCLVSSPEEEEADEASSDSEDAGSVISRCSRQ